ncbi:MAG: spheroidene monooxygenase [Chitinophagaceae bacterium]|nr:spheroidene monooxygenase [Chitinophagaceae bacterium]
MQAAITIIRYKKRFIYFAISAMAIHSLCLFFKKDIRFYKTLGCGRGGTFSKWPDWQQWGLLAVKDSILDSGIQTGNTNELIKSIYGSFIAWWFRVFRCETFTILLEPIEGHGTWNGKEAFGKLPPKSDYEGMIAILTRASIRIRKLPRFWKHVGDAANEMAHADGFLFSQGIGEWLWLRQATLSVWQSKEQMKNFAYKMKHHAEVIRKTRQEKWYSEDMFVRFKVLATSGTIKGANMLQNKL